MPRALYRRGGGGSVVKLGKAQELIQGITGSEDIAGVACEGKSIA